MNENLIKQKEILEKFDKIADLDEKLLLICNTNIESNEKWQEIYENEISKDKELCLMMESEDLDTIIKALNRLIGISERLS